MNLWMLGIGEDNRGNEIDFVRKGLLHRDDRAIDRFGGKPWIEKFPDNERLTINGKTNVHWYDCISGCIL